VNTNESIDAVIVTNKPDANLKIAIKRLLRQVVSIDNIYIIDLVDNELDIEIQNFSYDSGKIHYNGIVSNENDIINFEEEYEGTKIHIRYMLKDSIYSRGTKELVSVMSDADYILYMSQDVMPTSKYLTKKMLEKFRQSSNIACVYSMQYTRKNAGYIEKNEYDKVFSKKNSKLNLRKETAFFGYNDCCMYKKEVFDDIEQTAFLLEAYSMKKAIERRNYITASIYDVGVRNYKKKSLSYFLQKVIYFSKGFDEKIDFLNTDYKTIKSKNSCILITKYGVYKGVECLGKVIGKVMRAFCIKAKV